MPRITAQDVTKNAIAEKFAIELAKKDAEVKSLEVKVADLERQILSQKRGLSMLQTDEGVTKKILSLKAQMLSPTTIKDRLNYIGLDVAIEDIKNIIYNIDELEVPLKNYFNECVETFNNSLKTNNNILKNKAISENQYMIDQIKEIIENVTDPFEKTKQMDKLDKYLNTMNSLLKDVVLDRENEDKNIEIINIMADDYQQQKENVFRMRLDEGVRIIQ